MDSSIFRLSEAAYAGVGRAVFFLQVVNTYYIYIYIYISISVYQKRAQIVCLK